MKKILFLALLAFTFGVIAPEVEASQAQSTGMTKVAFHSGKKHRKHRKQQRKSSRRVHKVAFHNQRYSA